MAETRAAADAAAEEVLATDALGENPSLGEWLNWQDETTEAEYYEYDADDFSFIPDGWDA
jgi:hypothetical protein